VDDFKRHLLEALDLDLPSVIVLPIDYSLDVAIDAELGSETVAT
jgi:acetolactate synthase-1/2/3 large subunit